MAGEVWDVLGCKWTRQVIEHLSRESARFNEIERNVDVPTSTLSDRLERLERADVIARTVEDASPPAVRYSLTEKGERLADLVAEIEALD